MSSSQLVAKSLNATPGPSSAAVQPANSKLVRSITAAEVTKKYADQLTNFEKTEIQAYEEVYYIGQPEHKTWDAKIFDDDESATNKQFQDDQGVQQFTPGDHIAYRYQVEQTIGKGSFACVQRAMDHKTGRTVALKVQRGDSRTAKRLLVREISILEHLSRQDPNNNRLNIVHLYEHFWFRGSHVMAFETLSVNLYDLLAKCAHVGFEQRLVVKFARYILSALETLALNGIIHVDLKPENILLRSKTRTALKIIDFGWSHFVSQKPFCSDYIQSRFYRAPEIMLGGRYSKAIDMWSFGTILAEMVIGLPAFAGCDRHDQMSAITEVIGFPPSSLLAGYSNRDRYFSRRNYPFYCEVAEDRANNIVVIAGGRNAKGRFRGPPGSVQLHDIIQKGVFRLVRNSEAIGFPPSSLLAGYSNRDRYFSRRNYPFYCEVAEDRANNIVVIAGGRNAKGRFRGPPGSVQLHDIIQKGVFRLVRNSEAIGFPPSSLLAGYSNRDRYFSRRNYPFYCEVAEDRANNIVVIAGGRNAKGRFRGPPGSVQLHDIIQKGVFRLVRNSEVIGFPPSSLLVGYSNRDRYVSRRRYLLLRRCGGSRQQHFRHCGWKVMPKDAFLDHRLCLA